MKQLPISEEKYLQWMEEYFSHENGSELKNEIMQASNDGSLSKVWELIRYGRFGMHVRNYMRYAHPEIDRDFPHYNDFEDYSWELIQKLVEKWRKTLL